MSKRRQEHARDDSGDGSVVAVILLVAITIAVSAAVFLWVGNFSKHDTDVARPAIRLIGLDLDDDSDPEWIRLNLVAGREFGYQPADLLVSVTFPSGATATASATEPVACNAAQSAAGVMPLVRVCSAATANFFDAASSNPIWHLGEIVYLPCQAGGTHSVTVATLGTLALREDFRCGAPAT